MNKAELDYYYAMYLAMEGVPISSARLDGEWDESLHPRDEDGKFSDGTGGGTKAVPAKDTHAKTTSPSGAGRIKVAGPKATKQFISEYTKAHPEIKQDAKKYANVLNDVTHFKEKYPNAEPNKSYDAVTGELVDVNKGYCVTFHQNKAVGDEYGDYDADDYAAMCAIAMKELGADTCYIGYFGNPEVSFNCPDFDTAKRFAIEHNQQSVYDAANGELWINKYWDEKLNPIAGWGSN